MDEVKDRKSIAEQEVAHFSATQRRDALVYLGKMAQEQGEYETVFNYVSLLADLTADFTREEMHLISNGCKGKVIHLRSAYELIDPTTEDVAVQEAVQEYKDRIKKQIVIECEKALELLNSIFRTNAQSQTMVRIFLLQQIADFNRYLAEIDASHGPKALSGYKTAFALAQSTLHATDPIRLSVALNYSVCLRGVSGNQRGAITLAKAAVDDASTFLNSLEETFYDESTVLLQLIRNNMFRWSAETQPSPPSST